MSTAHLHIQTSKGTTGNLFVGMTGENDHHYSVALEGAGAHHPEPLNLTKASIL
jgi:hypothetical protein